MTRTDLALALRMAITRAAPELSAALAWMESTDPCLDIDDARLAECAASVALADAASEGEMPMSEYEAAWREGALGGEMAWDDEPPWTEQDERDALETEATIRNDVEARR